jgi:hypothetical protein
MDLVNKVMHLQILSEAWAFLVSLVCQMEVFMTRDYLCNLILKNVNQLILI